MKLLAVITLMALAVSAMAVRRHFDAVYYICGKDPVAGNISYICRTNPEPNPLHMCMCKYDFDRLNSVPNHYIMSGGPPQWVPEIAAAGNQWAFMQDKISDDFPKGTGAAYAAKKYAVALNYATYAKVAFPKYFFLNELSIKRWSENRPGYHKYIVDMVKYLKAKKTIPVVFAPFMDPTKWKASWVALKNAGAYIAVEAYMDSQKIIKASKTNNGRYAYIKKQLAASVKAFGAMGIPKNRLLYFEHYGTTPKDKHYGRSAVSEKDWIQIIKLRAQAFKGLKVYGTGGYGWIGNGMKLDNSLRGKYYDHYIYQSNKFNLP